MRAYHRQGSLAPRDVVARGMADQMAQHKTQFVYLDISGKDPSWLEKRFPTISRVCRDYGYDLAKNPIPVVPVAHYSCGGILVSLKGKTSIKRLRAIGEVSCTGLHGANRLASTSLLECLVWGQECGKDMARRKDEDFHPPQVRPWQYEHQSFDRALLNQDWMTLRATMWNYVGPTRSLERLHRASRILRNLRAEVKSFYDSAILSDELIGLRNAVDAAVAVVNAAHANRQSLGCHYITRNVN